MVVHNRNRETPTPLQDPVGACVAIAHRTLLAVASMRSTARESRAGTDAILSGPHAQSAVFVGPAHISVAHGRPTLRVGGRCIDHVFRRWAIREWILMHLPARAPAAPAVSGKHFQLGLRLPRVGVLFAMYSSRGLHLIHVWHTPLATECGPTSGARRRVLGPPDSRNTVARI